MRKALVWFDCSFSLKNGITDDKLFLMAPEVFPQSLVMRDTCCKIKGRTFMISDLECLKTNVIVKGYLKLLFEKYSSYIGLDKGWLLLFLIGSLGWILCLW